MAKDQTSQPICNTFKPSNSLKIGKATILLEQDETTREAFIDGVQAGFLTFEVYGKKSRLFDADLIMMITSRQNARLQSVFYNAGFVLGNLSSIAKKSCYTLSNAFFCKGYVEGFQTSLLLKSRSHLFTASELTSLLSWRHKGQNSAFNAGYITGFIQSLTDGRASLPIVGRTIVHE